MFRAKIPKVGHFEPKSINLLSLMKFCLYPCYKGADFKSDIRFQIFWAQTPKFRHFEPKGINFLILTKFCLYPVSKVLISNQTFVFRTFKPKSPNFGILGQKKINFLILAKWHLPLFNGSDFSYNFFDQVKLLCILVLST